MTQVVYADILVVLNAYIGYGLLSLTALLMRKKRSRLRLLISALLCGAYSLIILFPLSSGLLTVSRMLFSVAAVRIAFGKVSPGELIRCVAAYYGVSFIFAGLMTAVWYLFAPEGMYYGSGVLYFDINAIELTVLTVVCYLIIELGQRLLARRVPENTVYDCQLFVRQESYHCHCFLDTGNSLRDCYTGRPVMIVKKEIFSRLIPEDIMLSPLKLRLIPCSTLSGESLLYGFSCDRVELRSLEHSAELRDITVALTEERILGGSFDGILPADLLQIITEKRVRENEETDAEGSERTADKNKSTLKTKR